MREEALPEIGATAAASNGGRNMKPLFSGCSMGGFHSSNFVFRFPELASGVMALSARLFDAKDFFGGDRSGDIFFNSPLDYLPGLDRQRCWTVCARCG